MHKVTQDSIFNEHEKFETFLECPYLIIKLWRAKSIQNKPGIGTFTKKKKKKSTGDCISNWQETKEFLRDWESLRQREAREFQENWMRSKRRMVLK